MTSLTVPDPEEILRLILATTDGYFEDDGPEEDLRVTIRITIDVAKFLRQCNDGCEAPLDARDVEYVMGTIQSGIDEFVLLGQSCHSFIGAPQAWRPIDVAQADVGHVTEPFFRYLSVLTAERSAPVDRVLSLLHLVRLQLAFFAYYFPWGTTANAP